MRRGIGLRGYAQQDPLNEFRREAFRLYEELRGLIRHGVASTIFRVTVTAPAGRPAAATRPWRVARRGRGGAGRRQRRRRGRGRPARGDRAGGAAAAAAAPGSADPARRPAGARGRAAMRESLGDEPVAAARRLGRRAAAERRPRPGYTPTGARIGRNDPCWCGSGAKYKKCHGR